jgi:hypothetical protein
MLVEPVAKSHEFIHRERFRTPPGIDIDGGKPGIDGPQLKTEKTAAQGIAQRLAALAKGGLDDLKQEPLVFGRHRRLRIKTGFNNHRADLWTREKMNRVDLDHFLKIRTILQHDGQAPIVTASGARQKPIGHFALQHQYGPSDQTSVFDQADNDLRGNIVGQISEHDDRTAAFGQMALEGYLEKIGLDQFDVDKAMRRQLGPQEIEYPRIFVDSQDLAGKPGGRNGQGPQAGTDLQHDVFRADGRLGHNLASDARAGQKILPEPFAGP